MYLALAIFFYFFGSVIMNITLFSIWKMKNDEASPELVSAIHILSVLWPLSLILAVTMSFVSYLKKTINGSK